MSNHVKGGSQFVPSHWRSYLQGDHSPNTGIPGHFPGDSWHLSPF